MEFSRTAAHVLLHGGLLHPIDNMIFLWVFGNAVWTNTNNFIYLILFVACAVLATAVHVVADGSLAIGASGAINGILGLVLALVPLIRVSVSWWIEVWAGEPSRSGRG